MPSQKPAVRQPWVRPRLDTLSGANAEAGFVAVNPEQLGKGS